MSRNVYIDCGAYDGDTLNCEERFDFRADYKIAFEPNPNFFAVLATQNVNELHNAIVWNRDEIIEFSVDPNEPAYGSTAIKSKKSWNDKTVIETHAIDFAKYLLELKNKLNFTKLVIKMDIEGAEFKVLEHLHQTGADKLIDELYVETHENKISGYSETDKNNLLNKLQCGKVEEWR